MIRRPAPRGRIVGAFPNRAPSASDGYHRYDPKWAPPNKWGSPNKWRSANTGAPRACAGGSDSWRAIAHRDSDVEVFDVDGVVFDEAAALFDVVAHEQAEDAVGLARVDIGLLQIGRVL